MTTLDHTASKKAEREPFDYDTFLHMVLLAGVATLFVLAGYRVFTF